MRQGTRDYTYGNNWCRTYRNISEWEADLEITLVEEKRVNWTYQSYPYDISNIIAGGSATYPIGDTGSDLTVSWTNGCIEEASTSTSATWDPIPADAYDLDINLKPTTNALKWKPMLPPLVYRRYNGYSATTSPVVSGNNSNWHPSFDCPKAAFRLTEIERDDLESYLLASNGFIARSNTYHDLGMIWGARFISPLGIFQDDNEAAPNGDAIARHLIFMTDGELMVSDGIYGTYGIEWWDRRVSPDGSSSQSRHAARFLAACRQARAIGITVWVVAFGTEMTQNLKDCVDNNDQRYFSADDGPELKAKFQEIAQRIAALRLTS